jgi:hypothetical protein
MQDTSAFADGGSRPVSGTEPEVTPAGIAASAPSRGAASLPAPADRVQSAFVALAVARLERDHVALLAAICDLELDRPGSAPVIQQALAAVLREELRQTQRALERAALGTLGYCERCHAPLAISVLLSQPAATHCPNCAAVIERGHQIH